MLTKITKSYRLHKSTISWQPIKELCGALSNLNDDKFEKTFSLILQIKTCLENKMSFTIKHANDDDADDDEDLTYISDAVVDDAVISGLPSIAINDVAIRNEPINDEPVYDEPINDEPINDEPINDVAINNEPINDVAINNEAISSVAVSVIANKDASEAANSQVSSTQFVLSQQNLLKPKNIGRPKSQKNRSTFNNTIKSVQVRVQNSNQQTMDNKKSLDSVKFDESLNHSLKRKSVNKQKCDVSCVANRLRKRPRIVETEDKISNHVSHKRNQTRKNKN